MQCKGQNIADFTFLMPFKEVMPENLRTTCIPLNPDYFSDTDSRGRHWCNCR